MANYDGWEPLEDKQAPQQKKILGRGGQGTVYLARSPQWAGKRRATSESVRKQLIQTGSSQYDPIELARCLSELSSPDPVENLGALKHFDIPSDDKDEETKAIGRLQSEIHALENVEHPAVIKLLHSNVAQRFIVTEYHRHGTLDRNLNHYQGNVLAALKAFKALADGVVEIHGQGAIHRDIKPENIFVTTLSGLVLGDFGIVFFQPGQGGRFTSTYERVGSHFWMAPWAYDNARLELGAVRPALDIFPLAKVLWSMISGRNGFPFWEYDRDNNNLQKMFPDDPAMPLVNGFLAKCIVREEAACRFASVRDMVLDVDTLINKIHAWRGYKADGAEAWPCHVCGKGMYHPAPPSRSTPILYRMQPVVYAQIPGRDVNNHHPFSVFVCDHCGHAELFKGWTEANG